MKTEEAGGISVICPYCGAFYVYSADKIAAGTFFQCQNCAKWLHVVSLPEGNHSSAISVAVEKEAAARERRSRPRTDFHLKRDLPSMFMYGLLFSLIMIAVLWIWVYVVQLGTLLAGQYGSFVAIAVVAVGFVTAVGYTSMFLAQNFWDIHCSRSWKSLIAHGTIMSVLVLTAAIPAIAGAFLLLGFRWDVYAVIEAGMVVLYWGIVGAIGRRVAYMFVADEDS